MKSFIYTANPARVIFGFETIKDLPGEVIKLGVKRPFVLSTPGRKKYADTVETILSAASIQCVGQFNNAKVHTPVEVTEEALKIVTERQADCLVSMGGGSVIDLGKAIALRTDLPQIVIPTTYSGSEMTAAVGQKKNGVKFNEIDPKILPEVVIYDVDFTLTFPPALSTVSGVNAIAHAAEALYSQAANPIVDMMAVEGIRAIVRSLPIIMKHETDKDARSDALYGAWLCSSTVGLVGMSLHHKLCHTIGGLFNLPHSETHTIILPHALAYNAPNVPDAMAKLATALNSGDAIQGMNELLVTLKVKRSLKEIGMLEDGIDKAADLVVKNPYWNPRPVERNRIRELIRRAWAGEPARADL